MPLTEIDTLLLDLGGVLIDVDYARTAQAFASLGLTGFDLIYSKAKQTALFDRFETGELTGTAFRQQLREMMRIEIGDEELDRCWNAMLGTIPEARITLLKRLREHYTLLLLSNTNNIHVPAFTRIILEKNGIADLKDLFDGAYFSCEIGLRKPHREAFFHVLERHDALADRTLFIDDSIQHVEGARNAGLQAEHLDLSKEDVIQMVQRLDLL